MKNDKLRLSPFTATRKLEAGITKIETAVDTVQRDVLQRLDEQLSNEDSDPPHLSTIDNTKRLHACYVLADGQYVGEIQVEIYASHIDARFIPEH